MASSVGEPALSHQERFFNYFRLEASALQEQMARLEGRSVIGGERQDAINHCLAGIAKLQKEVQDAASYTTAYDQRVYSEGIKALQEKLNETRAAFAPKSKFSFKSQIKKNDSAISLSDAAELAAQQRLKVPGSRAHADSSEESSAAVTPANAATPPSDVTQKPLGPPRRGSLGGFLQAAGVSNSGHPSIDRNPISSDSVAVSVSSRSGAHIILPATAAREACSASLTRLQHCVVDMSVPTSEGKPYANLTVKNVKQSLLICGSVQGSAHVTAVHDSVILVTALQLRMHDCRNCTVYLHVNSAPVIEDCSDMRFAELPPHYSQLSGSNPGGNQWRHVQDFKWLKPGPNPHWSMLASSEYVSNEAWMKIALSGSEWPLDDILNMAGVPVMAG